MSKEKPHKKNKNPENDQNKTEEPETAYFVEKENRTITISTLEELKELDRKHTAKLSPVQRMEYLRKLNENLFGFDLSHQEEILQQGEIIIRKKS